MKDAKKEPSKKEKKENKTKDKTKPNPKKRTKTFLKKRNFLMLQKLASNGNLVVIKAQQQKLSEKRFAGVPRVVKRLLKRPTTQPQLLHHCQKQEFWFSYKLRTVITTPPPQVPSPY